VARLKLVILVPPFGGADFGGLTDVAGEDDDVLHGKLLCVLSSGPSLRQDPEKARRVTRARWTERTPETPRGPGWSGQPQRGNTARTDAGLRARARTGLGDCQSKGWPRRQRCAGSPCQTLSPRQSGLPDPSFSTSLATKTAITSLCHPCPCLPGVAAPRRDGLSIPEHSGHGPHQWLISISRHCRSAS
jgi:hypothetical protein